MEPGPPHVAPEPPPGARPDAPLDGATGGPDPHQVVRYLNLGPCSVMADLGCGQGEFALEAAEQVQPSGLVFALDARRSNLEAVDRQAAAAGLLNVHLRPFTAGQPLPVDSELVDAVVVSRFRYPFTPFPPLLSELHRVLKPTGLVLWVDSAREPRRDPPPAQWADRQDVVNAFTDQGFILFGTCDVGPRHGALKFYCRRQANEPMNNTEDIVPS